MEKQKQDAEMSAEDAYREHLRIENPEDPYNGNPEEKYVMRSEDDEVAWCGVGCEGGVGCPNFKDDKVVDKITKQLEEYAKEHPEAHIGKFN